MTGPGSSPARADSRPDDPAQPRARSVAEAEVAATFHPCACGGVTDGWELITYDRQENGERFIELRADCPGCGRVRVHRFDIFPELDRLYLHYALPTDGPSALVDPMTWLALAQDYSARVESGSEELPPSGPESVERPRWVNMLTYAVTALDEVLRFIPPGADEVPAEAFRATTSRAFRDAAPSRFTRDHLENERAEHARRLAAFVARYPAPGPGPLDEIGDPWDDEYEGDEEDEESDGRPSLDELCRRPNVRSREELGLFFALHPCACGHEAAPPHEASGTLAGLTFLRVLGPCAGCGVERRFLFRRPEEFSVPARGRWAVEPGPSELLDPGEWVGAADLLLQPFDPESADPTQQYRLSRALLRCQGAIAEALAFLPPGADAVPPAAFWSQRGRAIRNRDPERFGRARLVLESLDYVQRSAVALGRGFSSPEPEGGPEGS